jgi:single-strand DNA-binding protein
LHLCSVDETNKPESSTEIKIIYKHVHLKMMDTKLKSMNALRNKVQLIGNLANAPEIRNTESGKKMVRFSVATNETYRNANGEKVTETQWHNLVAWGKIAEIAGKYLSKGSEVAIEGKITSRSYTGKEGIKKYFTEIQVHELLMLGAKPVA